MYISPANISKESNVNIKDVYKVLDVLPNLQRKYVVICPDCKKKYMEYDNTNDIPDGFVCNRCNFENRNTINNTYILYETK